MMISGIGASNGTQNQVPSADLRSIESKIQKLKQQLKQVKGDDQIKRLEEQKRKLEQKVPKRLAASPPLSRRFLIIPPVFQTGQMIDIMACH